MARQVLEQKGKSKNEILSRERSLLYGEFIHGLTVHLIKTYNFLEINMEVIRY